MPIAVFDARPYDRTALAAANAAHGFDLHYLDVRLTPETAPLAAGCEAITAFVNDRLDSETVAILAAGGTRVVALRCAGFDNVDLAACAAHGITVHRVPAYSPHAVAEHAVALLLCLNRKLHRAHARVREGNFDLDGLVGRDMFGQVVGVLGTGKIGRTFAQIMRGFGCRVIAWDQAPDPSWGWEVGVEFLPLPAIIAQADVLSLHLPLAPGTRHLIGQATLQAMKPGAILINTGRGGLVDTRALIEALKSGHLGGAALDVYEREAGVFFADHSRQGLVDDDLARLTTFPNVLLTGHQAYLTREALEAIAATTLQNVADALAGRPGENQVTATMPAPPRP
jgi:D-lactate dehydrogenase